MQFRIWVAMGIAALGWGTSGVATRAALDSGIEPLTLNAWRIAIALAAIVAYTLVTQRRITVDRATWKTGSVLGITNLVIPFVLFTHAYRYASAGFVGLIVALVPLITAVIANFMLPDEKLKGIKVLGLSLGFFGIAVLLYAGDSGIGETGQPFLAGMLSLVSVASISFAGVYAKGRAGTYEVKPLVFAQFTIGAAVLIIVALAADGLQRDITTWGWALLGYMAILGTVVPFTLLYWILRHASATKASLIGYVVPLIAITAGIVFLDEKLEFGIAAGGVLILAGVIITDRAERAQHTVGSMPTA